MRPFELGLRGTELQRRLAAAAVGQLFYSSVKPVLRADAGPLAQTARGGPLSLARCRVNIYAVLLAAPPLALLLWATAVLFATEPGVPTIDVTRFRRVLAVFPHPDDEALTCAGTLHRLSTAGAVVTLVVLTRGERGTPDGTSSGDLGRVRAGEVCRAAAALGVSELVQEDLGDGQLGGRRDELTALFDRMLARAGPDLVVTYDLAGLYGHDDHIVCSEVLTELVRRSRPSAALWYVTPARRLQAFVPLPEALRERRAAPTHKVLVGAHLRAKTRAILAHRTQRRPAWLLLSVLPFEHFAAVPTGSQAPPQDSSNTRRNAPR